jgi:NAD(P)-dependent dehydrogenase (short-subunit alcohol dehydrogenase family)
LLGRLDFQDLQGQQTYSGSRAYNQSKLANVVFTYELARRLDRRVVTANALHPGRVRTGFGAEDQQTLWRLVAPLVRPFLRSPARGAALPVYLASSPEVDAVTGTYFAAGRPRRSSASSYDKQVTAKLWRISADLVGLDESSP